MRGGWAIKREPVDLTVSSLKEHVKIKVVPVVESAPNIVMSEEGSSSGGSGEVAQAGLSQEMLVCIRAVVEEVMDKRRSHRRDSAVESATGGASGSATVEPSGTAMGE